MKCQRCRRSWTPPPPTCTYCGWEPARVYAGPTPRISRWVIASLLLLPVVTLFQLWFATVQHHALPHTLPITPYDPIAAIALAILGVLDVVHSQGRRCGIWVALLVIVASGALIAWLILRK